MNGLVFVVAIAVAIVAGVGVAVLVSLDRRGDRKMEAITDGRVARVREAVDTAYQHLEISPKLADEVIEASRDVDYGSPSTVQATTERLLAIARAERGQEPDLAIILIDILRRDVR